VLVLVKKQTRPPGAEVGYPLRLQPLYHRHDRGHCARVFAQVLRSAQAQEQRLLPGKRCCE